jgi:hypothetical protein
MTVADEPTDRLDQVARHLLAALEEVATPAPDRRLEERRAVASTRVRHQLEQRLAPRLDRELLVVGDCSGGTLEPSDRREELVDHVVSDVGGIIATS